MLKRKTNMPAASLDVVSCGLAVGSVLAIAFLLLGFSGWLFGFGTKGMMMARQFYSGGDAEFIGSIVSAIWGFFEGFIIGAAVAWFYNLYSQNSK